jgi:hypothetical protein
MPQAHNQVDLPPPKGDVSHSGERSRLRSAPFDDRYCSPEPEVYYVAEGLAGKVEIRSGLYSRRLQGKSRLKLIDGMECLVVNFMRLHFTDPGRCLAVPLGKDDYHGTSLTYRTVNEALKGLEICGYVQRFKGFYDKKTKSGEVTRFQATPKLVERFDFYSLDPTMIRLRERQPLVELRPSKQMRRELLKVGRPCPKRLPWPKEHRREKAGMEVNLRKINAALAQQFTAIHIEDTALADALSKQKRPVNLFQRALHRVFTTDPRKGGRFVGAWWFTVPNELRKHIRMSAPGKPPAHTVELDYEALHFRMMYAAERVPCVVDPYSIYADPTKCQATRKAVKLVSLMMINASSNASAKKAAERKISKKFRKWWSPERHGPQPRKVCEKLALMWPGCPPLETLMLDIANWHAPIAKHFCTGAGRWLMFKDSQIAERIMLRMIDQLGVAPLAVHDSFIVRYDYEDALREVMHEEFTAIMGAPIRISKKPPVAQPTLPDERGFYLYSRMLDAWEAAPALR